MYIKIIKMKKIVIIIKNGKIISIQDNKQKNIQDD